MIRLLIVVCLVAPSVFAQDGLPELSEDRAEALRFPVDPGTELTTDNHYAQLIAHVGTWDNLMGLWNAQPELRPAFTPIERFRTVGSVAFAEPGEPFVFSARFIRKATLAGRPNIERWVVNPYDEATGDRAATPVVVFVDRRITGRIQEPQSGWYVLIASRAYRTTTVESVRGNVLPTQSFIGAVFYTGPTPEGDLTETFAWIGVGIAVVIAFGIVMFIVVVVHLRGSRDGASTGSGAEPNV
ncbi:MAG: hypothetical protein Tsb0013_13480 [Phycisphaerales bacterium]